MEEISISWGIPMNPSMSAELLRHRHRFLQEQTLRDRRWYALPRRGPLSSLRRRRGAAAERTELVPCCA